MEHSIIKEFRAVTPTEILIKNKVFLTEDINQHFNLDISRDCYVKTQKDIVKSMKEYAILKCQELLEIVVEKAAVENECYPITPNTIGNRIYTENDGSFFINKGSILNNINLDKFVI